jgi:hypothetical protein
MAKGKDYKGNNCAGNLACKAIFCQGSVSSNNLGHNFIQFRFKKHNLQAQEHTPKLQDATNRTGKMLHFYGVGNHPASGGRHLPVERLGIFNATQYQKVKLYGLDNPNVWGKDG